MDELDERIELLHQSVFVDEVGKADLEALVDVLTKDCGVPRSNEQLATLVTHVAAAFKRTADGEKINPISNEVLQEIKDSPFYDEAAKIQGQIIAAMKNELSEDEKNFVLVHVGGLLMVLQA